MNATTTSRLLRPVAAILLALSGVAVAQGTIPAWDVISVKPNKGQGNRIMMMYTPNGFHTEGATLRMLTANAYGVRPDLVTGLPGWADSAHFDIEAKVEPDDAPKMKGLTRAQNREMLQALLSQSFGLKEHSETKEMQVYELVVGKGGIKMPESAVVPPPPPGSGPSAGELPKPGSGGKPGQGMMMMRPGEITAQGSTMDQLSNALFNEVQHNVIDKTGLTAKYDITLKYASERALNGAVHDNGSDAEATASIFTALQEQLGLKLQSAKGPVESIVVDHVEQPAEN